MELLIVVLLVVLIMTMITIYYKLYNQYIRLYNNEQNRIDEYASIKRDYKFIIDILEKQKCDNLTALSSNSEITNSFIKELSNINTKIDKLDKFVNNLQLDISNNNKYYSIYDNKLDDVILNNHINRDNIELIGFNINKLIKSLEAKNSLCKCKSTKTSTKKKKEETQADNS